MEPLIGTAAGDTAGLIKDSDTARFMTDVIEASMTVPVLVDFWAPWCQPCKTLGPMIEKVVREARGAVKLVKINIDKNQELAQQLRIQSIPAVYAFHQGRPVDGFVGSLPEAQIRSFIKRLAGEAPESPLAQAVDQAKAALEAGDAGTASAIFAQVLAREPGHVAAAAGLAHCYLLSGDSARAKQIIDELPREAAQDAEVVAVRAAIELAAQSAEAGDIGELLERLAHDPKDHQSRFDLATALFAAGKREAAVDELLELFRRDRKWNEEAARLQLLKFFEAMGPTHPLTVGGRRRLSSLMFA